MLLLDFFEQKVYSGKDLKALEDFQKDNPKAFVGLPDFMKPPVHLGIDSNLNAAYYIGADWLNKDELAAVVLPKMKDIDFFEMFMSALDVSSEADYFSKCYGIAFDEPFIDAPKELNQLTPLLIIHYITVLQRLVNQGIKKDYVLIEDNLKAKIKGHLLLMPHLNQNVIPKRLDRAYCQYQVYTEDIPINRLLKKALLFAEQMVMTIDSLAKRQKLQSVINSLKTHFENVSDEVSISEVRSMNGNKLFRHYADAIRIAKDILRRYDYSITEISEMKTKTPPFWIDMSRLFELYVLSKLNACYPNQIKFQVKGHLRTQADYIHTGEQIIIDAKYKPRYDYTLRGIIDDIREISGYARDTKILKELGADVSGADEVRCLIIYPVTQFEKLSLEDLDTMSSNDITEYESFANVSEQEQMNSSSLWDSATAVPWFRNFKKISITLPTLKHM